MKLWRCSSATCGNGCCCHGALPPRVAAAAGPIPGCHRCLGLVQGQHRMQAAMEQAELMLATQEAAGLRQRRRMRQAWLLPPSPCPRARGSACGAAHGSSCCPRSAPSAPSWHALPPCWLRLPALHLLLQSPSRLFLVAMGTSACCRDSAKCKRPQDKQCSGLWHGCDSGGSPALLPGGSRPLLQQQRRAALVVHLEAASMVVVAPAEEDKAGLAIAAFPLSLHSQ